MRWKHAVPTLVAALLAAACNSDRVNPVGPRSRASFAGGGSTGVDLDQWANGVPPSTAAMWQNGDLNGNNSVYGEDKVVPFRLAIEGLDANQHFITIQYDFTASGHKAYDFLTSADATETTIFSQICGVGGGGVSTLCGSSTGAMPASVPHVDIPYLEDTFAGPTGKTVDGAIASASGAGSRTIRFYGIGNANQVSLSQMAHTGDFTGNSEAQFLVTFTPDVAGPVLIVWGGHLAESGYWDGTPNGASTISGAPWHMRTLNLDGGGGANQDRSIQPSAIVPPVLSITKVADPVGPVNAGTDIGFDIVATNSGPGTAFNVAISDALPGHAGISWSTSTTGCSVTGTAPSQTLSCLVPVLLSTAGANTFTANVTSHTTAEACALITNDGATVSAANAPTPKTSGSASVQVNCPNLGILKTAKPAGPVSAGDNIGFEIVISNTGAGAATNVGITDPLPSVGGTWTISSQTASACSISSGTLTCTGINLAATTGTYTVDVTSATTASACGVVNNTATITGTNKTSSASVTVNCPSLSITKTADASPVSAGSQIGFTVTVSNAGPGTAKGVSVSDPLPSGLAWSISGAANGFSISGGTLSFGPSDIASGASATVHIVATTTGSSCATIPNTATASLTNGTAPSPAQASIVVQCPSLSITKTADAAIVSAGSPIGFTVTVSNAGPGTAKSVSVSDPLPTGTGISWSISPASTGWSISNGNLVLASTDLASGASTSVHVVSNTTGGSCGIYTNTATASLTNGTAPQPASASTTVQCPNVSITKTADALTVNAGSQIGFTVTVTNSSAAGTGTATGVTVNDPLPTGTGISWSISPSSTGWSISNGTLLLASTDLVPGASTSVHVVSGTTGGSCATYNNTATVSLTNSSGHPSASASTTVQCPTLTITKTADNATVSAGSPIGFTVTVKNTAAAATATGVTVNDPLPTGTDINWVIDPASTGWSISGGSLILSSTDLAGGASTSVHITSTTTGNSCKAYSNTATASLTNGTAPQPVTATTTVQCPNLSITKTADNATVSAGSSIGFTITVSNSSASGTGTAKGVTVSDPLPTGTGINWSIAPASTGWSITSGTLILSSRDLAPGASTSVHVTSPTTGSSCQQYNNTATASLTNSSAHPQASASTTVQCPNVSLVKVADAAAVDSGGQIGFKITVSNSGPGTATGVTVNDPLPTGLGLSWSIAANPTAVGNWSISSGVLSLASTTLAPNTSVSVHVVSSTVGAVCKQYDNTASAVVGNGTSPQNASASEIVHCLANITVTKTVVGGGSTQFDFTQSTPTNKSYSMGNGGSTVTKLLQPGMYTLCEVLIPVGWSTSAGWSTTATLDGVPVTPYNPDASSGQDLGNRCVDVTVAYGDSKTLAWRNAPPPGGDSRTIGYWKNWSSCTFGGQYKKALSRGELYATLDGNLPQTIGILTLAATNQGCLDAVNILSKNDLKGTKMASDPAYNLAAQLLAAQLNFQSAKKVCPTAGTVALNAQNLLVAISFNGSGAFAKKMTATQISQANTWAQQLDDFNNNRPGSC